MLASGLADPNPNDRNGSASVMTVKGGKVDTSKPRFSSYSRSMASIMEQYAAFSVTKRTLAENLGAELLDAKFDREAFGNFYVSFSLGGRNGSIVLDRLQMFICDDLRGGGQCRMLFQDMRPVAEQELISILVSVFSSGRW